MNSEHDIKCPRRSTIGSAGYDLFAPFDIYVEPGEWATVDTGVKFDGSEDVGFKNWVFMIFPRSGLSSKYGMRIINTVPIIDQDYRGNIVVKITADKFFGIKKDERFLEGIFVPFGILSDEISPTNIRTGGHGSTGRM